MAIKLGSPRTTKFSIGTAELRIGPLLEAMKLKQENSIGLIDNATVEVSQESVDLTGGFPKVLVDTAVVSQESSITATLREYSRRNLQVMLGEGVVDVARTSKERVKRLGRIHRQIAGGPDCVRRGLCHVLAGAASFSQPRFLDEHRRSSRIPSSPS